MACVEKLPHNTSNCSSSDALQVFENDGIYSGYCFSCRTYVPNPYGSDRGPSKPVARLSKTEAEIASELAEISTYPIRDFDDRRLSKDSLEYFGIRCGVSEEDGTTITLHFYPYYRDGKLTGYKVRSVEDKRFWSIGEVNGDNDLFGWNEAIASGAKRLYITEGELDAVACLQVLRAKNKGTQWEKHNPAVVSLVNGAGSAAKALAKHGAAIRQHFKEVVLVFDNDEAGKRAFDEAIRVYPTAMGVALPGKDPNACIMEGKAIALLNCLLFKAEVQKNSRIINASTLFTAAREAPKWGLSWPWEGMTNLTRGIRLGDTIYLGAGVKMGKSEVVNAIGAHFIKEHNMPILMAKPEEANVKTVKMVASKMVGAIFHDPKVPMDYEAYDRGTALIADKLHLINLYQHLGWSTLQSDIIEAVQSGVKAVFIDPITNLTNGVASGDANVQLQDISQQLSAMALDMGFVAFIFCHLKAPDAGPSHERGGKVYSSQFAGSRAMMRSCNLMLALEGNKDPDLDEEERNIRKLIILEDREFGVSGGIDLYWNPNTALFSEIKK